MAAIVISINFPTEEAAHQAIDQYARASGWVKPEVGAQLQPGQYATADEAGKNILGQHFMNQVLSRAQQDAIEKRRAELSAVTLDVTVK